MSPAELITCSPFKGQLHPWLPWGTARAWKSELHSIIQEGILPPVEIHTRFVFLFPAQEQGSDCAQVVWGYLEAGGVQAFLRHPGLEGLSFPPLPFQGPGGLF